MFEPYSHGLCYEPILWSLVVAWCMILPWLQLSNCKLGWLKWCRFKMGSRSFGPIWLWTFPFPNKHVKRSCEGSKIFFPIFEKRNWTKLITFLP
jgi:hypothetical protein